MKKDYLSILRVLIERLTNSNLKNNFLQALPFWIASIITGLIAVLYARLFAWAEDFSIHHIQTHAWLLFIATPVLFVAGWFLSKRFAPASRGSGIPQVMAAIEMANPKTNHLIDKLLSVRIIIVKIISSLFMVMGGAAIGREGPTIQIAGSVFRKVNQLLPASWPRVSKKNMILTGAAAGLAAAFNTPLGGIVFAVEELAKMHISNFRTAIFTAVIIAGLTAQSFMGPYLYLGYPQVNNLVPYLIVLVILVALIAGFLGSLMSKLILNLLAWKRGLKKYSHELMYVLACALVMATIAYFVSMLVLGSGKAEMANLLFTNDKSSGIQLVLVRMLGPIISFTTGGAGGVFAPALSAGATLGAMVAGWFHLSPDNVNMLVLVGMVGFLTGVTRSPFTSAILVLEMTDRHSVILHLMLAGMIASLTAALVDKKSFYEHLKEGYMMEAMNEPAIPAANVAENDEETDEAEEPEEED